MLSRLREERGIALVMALMVMTVLTIVSGTAIYYSTASEHESAYSKASDTAYRLAETGLNNAMAQLGYNQTNALSTTALQSSEAAADSKTYATGTSKWWGTLNTTSKVWTLYGKGFVTNPSVGTGIVTRMVSATMQVTYSYNQPVNTQAWNYVYLTNKGGANVCDLTLANNLIFDAPLYLEGNLCLNNNATIRDDQTSPQIPITIVVKGKYMYGNAGSSIGISSDTLPAVYIAGGCGSSLSSVHTCVVGSGDHLYVQTGGFSTTPPSVSPPVVDWVNDGWYANANPGPMHPCAVVSGTPPAFDGGPAPNNTQQNLVAPYANGSAGTVNLTPAASYTCRTAQGELSWDSTTHTMTIRGVIYIDGNVTIGDGAVDEYNGQASMWVSGTATISGKMCGKRNADLTDCDFTAWNPNTEMWILAAHGNDGSGNSVLLPDSSGDKWEGGIYATNAISLANNGTIEGPIIGGSMSTSNNFTIKPFPVITTVPEGAPGNPNVYAQPNPPGGYSG